MSSPRDTQVPNPKEHIMSGDTAITLVGNLTADPELRFTQSGVPVADFTVASTPRIFDRASGEWKDGDALFLRCTLWRQPAENGAETLTKGSRAIVTGRLRQRSYETREGEKRTVVEVDVEEIGPSLRYATARVTRAGTRTPARSWCAACSVRCACPAPAGGTATAAPSAAEPSNPSPSCYPIGPPRSWPTCRPGSPGWSPAASPPSCWVSCYRWAGAYTPRWSAARPRPWPSGWRTSSVTNGSASSTPASASARSYRARTCRWSSGSTGATSTLPRSAPVATAGSR